MKSCFSLLCAAILSALAPGLFADEPAAAGEPPSIVVFLADDVDWKDFGCYGNDAIHTPNIDRLAADGLLFTHAFLTTSSCSPTRISVLTGKYPHATGAEDLHMPLPADQTFVSTYLKQRGYFTGHMQKTHYGPNGNQQFEWYSRGLDFEKFLDDCGDRPFFLWVGFSDAHRPYKAGAFDPPHDPAKMRVPPYLVDDDATRADLAMYCDEVARLDGNVGRMMNELKKRGRLENTLAIFFSDNGMPFPRAKGTLYDSGIGTPLVVSWPKVIQPGTRHTELASVIDLAPTILDAAGLPAPDDMQGRSMLPILKDPSRPGREMVFAERNWHNADEHMRSVRTARYKLIRNAYLDKPFGTPADCSNCPSWRSLIRGKEQGGLTPQQLLLFRAPRPELELYDLEADPWEFNNLADSAAHAEARDRLVQALDRWCAETGDFPPTKRRRADNVNRVTGMKFSQEIPQMTELE